MGSIAREAAQPHTGGGAGRARGCMESGRHRGKDTARGLHLHEVPRVITQRQEVDGGDGAGE